MRVRHKPWAKEYLHSHTNWVVIDPVAQKGTWRSLFEVEQPVHVEVGTGKGQFIHGMAKANPDINFIGIELHESVLVSVLEKLIEEPLPNIRITAADANHLTNIFQDDEIDFVYLNFSDPWPKTRHEKRRLTFRTFLAQYEQIMKSNGRIQLKTDNRGLFEYSLVSFSQYGMMLEEVQVDLHQEEDNIPNVRTEYEEKFSSRGQPIYRCVANFPNKANE